MNKLSSHQKSSLALIVALFIFVLWYLYDSYQASQHILNLILILPVSVLVFLLCLSQFIREYFGNLSTNKEALPKPKPQSTLDAPESIRTVLPIMGLFILYVITLPLLGFDVGSFIFLAAYLWFHKERRWVWIIGYAFCFALMTSLFFSKMLTYPIPMLILPTAY